MVHYFSRFTSNIYDVGGATNKKIDVPYGFITFWSERDAAEVIGMSRRGELKIENTDV